MYYQASEEAPYHISCGGIVYRETDQGREYALLFRGERFTNQPNTWHLPKGTLAYGEPVEVGAEREVEEETGLAVERVLYLGALQRMVDISAAGGRWQDEREGAQSRIPAEKTIHFFLFKYLDGDGSAMDHEHDALEWFSPVETRSKLTECGKQEEEVLSRAEGWFKKYRHAA